MKTIKIPKVYIISAFNGPTELVTPELLSQIMSPIETNKARILEGAIDIERLIENIICHHFFAHDETRKIKAEEFTNQILNSDWCSFSSKRKLLTHIINTNQCLVGEDKSKYENLLSKIMSYRNAFAHGELSTDGREVRLKYFQGNLKTLTLNDEYFYKVEKDFIECWEMTQKVALNTGTFHENF